MYTITFNNMAGELDRKTAKTPEEACQAAIQMLTECGVLYKDDSITIQGEEDDE